MRSRIAALLALLFTVALVPGPTASPARAASTDVVINELHTNTQPGQFDTFVELRNTSQAPVDISGWRFDGCNGGGVSGARATVEPDTTLDPDEHYLLASEDYREIYAEAPLPDQDFGASLTPDGGVVLYDATGTVVDAVGHSSPECVEGQPAPQHEVGSTLSSSRDAAGTDTDDNSVDFALGEPTPTASQDSGEDGGGTPREEPFGDPVPTVAEGDPVTELAYEAELLEVVGDPSASLRRPGNCCGVVRSGDAGLTVGGEPGDSFTLAVEVPATGRYAVSADYFVDPSFGSHILEVNGAQAGEEITSYAPAIAIDRRVSHGEVDLVEGTNEFTITLTEKDPRSSGQRISPDVIRLRQVPVEPPVLLTPPEGAAVAGPVPVLAVGAAPGDDVALAIDDEPVAGRAAIAGAASLVFEGDELQSASVGFDNRLVVQGVRIPLGSDVMGFDSDAVDVPGELLSPGENTISIAAGTVPTETNGNHDDFVVRNVRLELPNGTVIEPEEGLGETQLGDGCCPDPDSPKPLAVDYTFTIPQAAPDGLSYAPARAFAWDTTKVADGEHTITATTTGSQPGTVTHTVVVDNTAPTITSTSPEQGEQVQGDFVLDAQAVDGEGSGVQRITATLDGDPVEVPATLNTDDLADGEHTAVLTATDAAGNSTTETVTFTSVAETPDLVEPLAPADGAQDVALDPELRVRASDPAGDPLEVTFLEAVSAVPGAEGSTASQGTIPGEPPAGLDATQGEPLTEEQTDAAALVDGKFLESQAQDELPYQRFDLRVEAPESGITSVDVEWTGRTDAGREVVLYAFDLTEQAWTEVARADGQDQTVFTVTGAVDLTRTLDGDLVRLLVVGSDPFEMPQDPVNEEFKDPADYDFSLAWLTDTQYYSEGAVADREQFAAAYRDINQWIADNADERKIAYTTHTGDLINNWIAINNDSPEYVARAREEFEFASQTMDILEDAGMPYGVIPGNHDNKFGTSNDLYNEYFPPSRFEEASETADQDYYGGSWREGDNQNHYDLIEADGQELIIVYLGYVAGQEEIDWANDVLAEHADRKAIFATHEYIRPSNNPDGVGAPLSDENARSQGQELFEEVVLPNENVVLTLSGHVHGVALNIKRDVGAPGRTVVEMLANYQFYEVDDERRTGFFRLLQVDVSKGEIAVNTYSPTLDDHNADEFDGRDRYEPRADEFTTPVDFGDRSTTVATDAVSLDIRTDTVIGSDDIASGEVATTVWEGLTPGTRYSWYAVADDGRGGVADSQVVSFTTSEGPCADPDTRPTVVIGDQDSGVQNRDTGNGCTINDLIEEDRDWANHGAFVRHVAEVTRELRDEEVIDGREAGALKRAAAKSDVGRDQPPRGKDGRG